MNPPNPLNPLILYNHFHNAIRANNFSEIDRLRDLVLNYTGVSTKMPDRTLLDVLRRKIFIRRFEPPPDRKELFDGLPDDIFGEEFEDLFKL